MNTKTPDNQPETGNRKPETLLYVVGAGPGTPELITGEAAAVIGRCRCFAGGRRQLELAPAGAETCVIGSDLDGVRRFVAAGLKRGDVCVLASGDPGCYSILPFLKTHFNGSIRVVPGLSSVQLLAARLGELWQEWRLVSLHGREAWKVRPPDAATVYFCDGKNTPQGVARLFLEEMENCRVVVGSNLGGEEEEVFEGMLFDVVGHRFPGNSLLLVMPGIARGDHTHTPPLREGLGEGAATPEHPHPGPPPERGREPKRRDAPPPSAPGIPDGEWLRCEGVPLSKSEVRPVLLARARPRGRGVIWDVGAGTGSYAVECSLLEPGARVIAVDKNPEAVRQVEGNAARFGARVETVCGEAPECLDDLPRPDLVIVGGSGGRLEDIFSASAAALNPGGRIVITAVLKETMELAPRLFATAGLENREAVRVAISRLDGEEWRDNNPVVIFVGDKK